LSRKNLSYRRYFEVPNEIRGSTNADQQPHQLFSDHPQPPPQRFSPGRFAPLTLTDTLNHPMANQEVAVIAVTPSLAKPAPESAPLPVVVYAASSELVHPWHLVKELFRDIVRGRELGWRLFLRNLQSQYRQTLLGYFWAIMPPLITTLVWVGLQSFKVVSFRAEPGVPYAAYVLTGTILWQTFLNSLNSPLTAIEGAKDMLAKLNFPREALLLAGFGQMLFNLLIQLVLLVILLLVLRVPLPPTAPLFFVGLLMLITLGHGIGLLITPLGLLYTDIPKAIQAFAPFAMLLTPVLYAPPTQGRLVLLNYLNPVAPALVTTRDWLLIGRTDFLASFVAYSFLGVLATLLGLIVVRISMPFLIERMGS
jgi:lipopolysaccharide transport system permease protein